MAETFRVTISREFYGTKATTGYLSVNGEVIAYTLELPWRSNLKNKSCIPPGRYSGIIRYDHKDRWRIELQRVPGNRTFVEIHAGNGPSDSLGCPLVGSTMNQKFTRVGGSRDAYSKLRRAFYGTDSPTSCPNKAVIVEIENGPPSTLQNQ